MSREQNPRKKAIESTRRGKAKGHQTRRARGGKNKREDKITASARHDPLLEFINP